MIVRISEEHGGVLNRKKVELQKKLVELAELVEKTTKPMVLTKTVEKEVPCQICANKKSNKHHLTATMVKELRVLRELYELNPTDFWHTSDVQLKFDRVIGGEFSKLRHFGLTVKKEKTDNPKDHHQGYYMLTQKGIDFLNGTGSAPSYILTKDGQKSGESSSTVTINEEKFKI